MFTPTPALWALPRSLILQPRTSLFVSLILILSLRLYHSVLPLWCCFLLQVFQILRPFPILLQKPYTMLIEGFNPFYSNINNTTNNGLEPNKLPTYSFSLFYQTSNSTNIFLYVIVILTSKRNSCPSFFHKLLSLLSDLLLSLTVTNLLCTNPLPHLVVKCLLCSLVRITLTLWHFSNLLFHETPRPTTHSLSSSGVESLILTPS